MKKNCLLCGTAFVPKRSDALFCSGTCKAKYSRMKKQGGLNGIQLQPDQQKEEERPEPIKQNLVEPEPENKTKTVDMDLGEAFANVVFDDPDVIDLRGVQEEVTDDAAIGQEAEPQQKTGRQAQEPDGQTEEASLPEKYIPKIVKVESFAYKMIAYELSDCRLQRQKYEAEVARIEKLIENEKNRNGKGYVVASVGIGLGGSLLYNASQQPDKPALLNKDLFKEKKKKKLSGGPAKSSGLGFWGTLLVTTAALGIGVAVKNATEESREKEKADNIKKYEQELAGARASLEQYKMTENKLIEDLNKHPAYFTREEKELNPAYVKMKRLYEKEKKKNETSDGKPITNQSGLSGAQTKVNQEKDDLETDKILSMKKVANLKQQLLNFTGVWGDFLGKPQTNFFCVVHGLSGSGKSHFVMQFGKYLAQNFGNVLYVSGEEGFASTFKQKIKALSADIDRYYGAELKTGNEILTEIRNSYHFIIIDSLNNMGIDTELIRAIRARFKQSGIIAICQSTKDGKIRGSYEIVHDCDIAIKVMDGIATTTKNRFKEIHQDYDVFAVYRKKNIKPFNRDKDNGNLEDGFLNTIE